MQKLKFEIVNKTEKSKVLIADGYTFVKNKGKSEKYWTCKEKSCKSNGNIVGDFFLYSNAEHQHPRHDHSGEKIKAIKEMKELIVSANLKPKAAFEAVRSKYFQHNFHLKLNLS